MALLVFAAGCGVSRGSDVASATITLEDGTSREIDGGRVSAIADEIVASDRFFEIAYGGAERADVERDVLTRLIVDEISATRLEVAGGTIDDESIGTNREGLIGQLAGAFQAEADPEATAGEVAGEIPLFLDLLSELQAKQVALGDTLGVDLEPPTFPCVSHILVGLEDEELANDLKVQIDDGADFAELAIANSIDPGSGAVGGDLGCADPNNFVPEFRDAVIEGADGAVGELLGPVESQFGFHLIIVTGEEEQAPDTFALAQQDLQAALTTAVVVVDPDLGIWNPQTLSVAGSQG